MADINVTEEIIDINVTEEVITIEAPSGAYPFPNAVYSVFGRVGAIVAAEGDYSLTQLSDVTLTSPANGQVLKYNGTSWVNSSDADTGITTLNTLTALSQSFATGTSGTDFNISSATSTHTFNIPVASATNTGKLSSADWANFNAAYNDKINSAAVTGTTTKTLTLNQQDGGTITASWTDINTDAVTSVFGRTGAVVAASGDYTTTQVTEGTNLYFTNLRAQNAITLTTTGTSGAATYSGGTLNIPQYQGVLTNPVTGTGTTNTLPKFTGTSAIGNSNITDTGSLITLGSNSYVNGAMGIGVTPLTQLSLRVNKNLTGNVVSTGISQAGTVQSDVTTLGRGIINTLSTQSTTFTLPDYFHFLATQGTIGAGSAVTSQIGYFVDNTLTGAGSNFGFRGDIPSGTNRWNLYMNGTAANYLAGKLLVGSTTDAGAFAIQVTGDILASRVYSTGITGGVAYALDNNRSIRNIGGTTGTGTTFFDLNYSVFRREDGASTGARIGINIVPTETLDVSGTGRISGQLTAASFIPTSSTIPTNGMYLSGTNTLGFATNGTLDMVINERGDLGLGVTPSAWSAFRALQVGTASISQIANRAYLTANAFFNGTNWVYIASDFATQYFQQNGTHIWNTAPTGTASNTFTWTEAMHLNASGSLGIGTNSLTGFNLRIVKPITGAVGSYGMEVSSAVASDVTSFAVIYNSAPTTVAAAFTLPNLYHYFANNVIAGAGSTVTNQYGFFANSAMTGATNNFGFYGNIPAAANRWNLYMNGTANNYLAGSLGIGTTSVTGNNLIVNKNITGSTNPVGIYNAGTIQSDATGNVSMYSTGAAVVASAFTVNNIFHYNSDQLTIGAGATVTTQVGFRANNTLVGAGTNYGFQGRIPAQANAWNLFMDGTANNYMAGSLGIGSTSLTQFNFRVSKTITGNVTSYAQINDGIIQSDVTTGVYYRSTAATAAATFTTDVQHFNASQGTFGVGSTVTNQYGYLAASTLIGATNNYGFFGSIPSGTNRWNLYMAGTAYNYLGGRLGIGQTSATSTNVVVNLPITGGAGSNAIYQFGTVQSDVTSSAYGFRNLLNTAAATFTIPIYNHFAAQGGGTIGAGSIVTNQIGFNVESNMVGGTNNYGFYGSLASATNTWNLYMAGGASNYLFGNTGIGILPSYKLDVQDANIAGIANVSSFSVAGNGGAGRGVGILIGAGGSSNSVQVARLVGYQETASATANNASFAIQVANSSGTLTERVRVKTGGQMRFVPLAADPTGAEAGDVYYNSTISALKLYDGTQWRTITVI